MLGIFVQIISEAGMVSEILTLAALEKGKNVLVDGSLRDSDWYQGYFASLRNDYPLLKIGIIHVTAPREAIIERAEVCEYVLFIANIFFVFFISYLYNFLANATGTRVSHWKGYPT